MESMGTLDGFFSNSPDSEFNSNFCDWLRKKASINENPSMAWVGLGPKLSLFYNPLDQW